MSLTDHDIPVPSTEIVPDDGALRVARRERVLAEMERADVDILVIGREANARYVAGVRRLWTAGSRAFGPGCVLMRDGSIHLLSTWDEGVPDDIPREHLYGISFNSQTFLRVLSELDGAATARIVATDALTRSGAGMLATAFPNAAVIDGEQLLRRARSAKMPTEVDAIRASVAIAERALAATLDALRPGVTERHLTGVFMEAMANQGVTTPATQDVAWITSPRQPWERSSRDTPVAEGDLVAFDAGVISDGYFGELSRTIIVGEPSARESTTVRTLFRRRDELLDRLLEACVPGAPASDLLDAYAAAGVEAPPMPVARGLGHGFDLPLVSHALPETAAAERLEPGMVFGLSAFVWESGFGAAYTQQPVVVGDDGAQPLASQTLDPYQTAPAQTAPAQTAPAQPAPIQETP
jgi:Xaa-Pro dipeptidase